MIRQSENTDQNEVLSVSNYSPFGMELGGSHQNLSQQYAYKYNGKEVDGFSSYIDYGARWFDQNRAVWTSLDPMSEKYYGWNPYNYTFNNPIKFIDPDGMDVYYMTSDGRTVLAKKENKPDILYASDGKGHIKDTNKDKKIDSNDGVTVKTQGLIKQLSGVRSGAPYEMFQAIGEESKQLEDDLLKLFHFAANNTNTEFNVAYFKKNGKNYISLQTFGTPYGDNSFSPGSEALSISEADIKKKYHNHPSGTIYTKDYTERESMGQLKGDYRTGDYLNAYKRKKYYPSYVFFPATTNLYNVTKYGIDFIQKINNDYKRLKK
ncbi:MAG: RHS repeat-associated core domain-containing protein [Leadbetterella sp.]